MVIIKGGSFATYAYICRISDTYRVSNQPKAPNQSPKSNPMGQHRRQAMCCFSLIFKIKK